MSTKTLQSYRKRGKLQEQIDDMRKHWILSPSQSLVPDQRFMLRLKHAQ